MAHGVATASEGASLTKLLVVKASPIVETKEVGEICFGPWGRFIPRGVTTGNYFLVKHPWLAQLRMKVNHAMR